MENPRKQEPYIRLLELQALITEEWGEAVKEINEYLWKGNDVEKLEKALEEIKGVHSPLKELQSLLEVTLFVRKKINTENKG